MALTPWIRIGQPLEAVMSDYERIFDAWEQGGIRGLVFGRLVFADEQGQSTVPAFKGDPVPYQKRGLNAQLRDVPLQPDKEKLLHAMLADAKRARLDRDDLRARLRHHCRRGPADRGRPLRHPATRRVLGGHLCGFPGSRRRHCRWLDRVALRTDVSPRQRSLPPAQRRPVPRGNG